MPRVSLFQASLVALSLGTSLLLLLAIGALFLGVDWVRCGESLQAKETLYALSLSLSTALVSTVLVMLWAVPIGYTFSRFDFPGQKLVRTVLYWPIAFPELVLGLVLLLFLGQLFAGRLLDPLGLGVVFTRKGIVVAQFFTALPYTVRIVKTTMDGIDPRLEFVSQSLGYSPAATVLRITLPLARGGLLAATAMAFARSVGAFGSVLILAGGTRMYTETLPVALYLHLSYGNLDRAITVGLLLLSISFVGVYAMERAEVRG